MQFLDMFAMVPWGYIIAPFTYITDRVFRVKSSLGPLLELNARMFRALKELKQEIPEQLWSWWAVILRKRMMVNIFLSQESEEGDGRYISHNAHAYKYIHTI